MGEKQEQVVLISKEGKKEEKKEKSKSSSKSQSKELKETNGSATLNPFKAPDFESFAIAIGKKSTLAELNEAMSQLKVQTIYGEINMADFDRIITAKMFEFVKYGTARRVWKMMQKQDPSTSTDDLLTVLLEMARLEVEYGLRPITHVIPVAGSTYIKADGFLFYAKNSGKLQSIEWDDREENGLWTSRCIVTTADGQRYEGIATVAPTRNPMDDPRERARTKAMRRALRRAFPIGATDETFDEFEKISFEESKRILNHEIETPKAVQAVDDLRNLNE